MGLGLIRYLGLGSSRLVAWACLGSQLGTLNQLNARLGPNLELGLGSTRGQLRAQLGIGSELGTQDSTWLGLWISPAHLARLGVWDQAGLGSAWKPSPTRNSGLVL